MKKLDWLTEKIKRHKKLTIAVIVILVLAVAGVSVAAKAGKRKEEMFAAMNQMQTSKVERRTLVSSVSATGTLTSVESEEVMVNLNGVEVESVTVEIGDMVEIGQVLCTFDSKDIEENLTEAKTALSVTQQKTQMDLTSAERNLQNAKEDYDTDLKRGNTDLGVAYNDYVVALEDEEEAQTQWAEAKGDTIEKKGELELREKQLSEAQAVASAAGSSATHAQDFVQSVEALKKYVQDNQVTLNNSVMDKIGLGNNLSEITVGENNTSDFQVPTGATGIQSEIASHISALISLQTAYQNSQNAEAKVASLQQEVASWQTKYNTAKSNQSSLEKAYEQAVSASQSKLSSYDKQKRTLEDTEKSAENNVISKTDSLTTSQLNALSSGNSEEDKVEEYQQQLDDCTVEAPISGIISAVNIEEGDTYNGSAIVTIDDISSFEVTAEIDEYDIGKISKGQKVVIKTNATGDEELEGTVRLVSPKASGGGNSVTYTVIITVNTPNEMLRMDMTAKLSIILDSKENVLTVPYEAVREDGNGRYYVEVVDASGKNLTENAKKEMMPEGADFENMPDMPEGMDFENMPDIPEGMDFGNMPQMRVEEGNSRPAIPFSQEGESRPKGMRDRNNFQGTSGKEVAEVSLNTKRIYVEKGIESDYYIEIISSEITEGMEVVVPKTSDDNGGNIHN